MKISKDLLDKINKAETVEEKTKIIDMAGLQLSDEELEAVVGGFGLRDAVTVAIAATAIGMVTPLPAHAQEAQESQIECEDEEYEDEEDYEEDDSEEDEEEDYEEDNSEEDEEEVHEEDDSEEDEEDECEEDEYDDEHENDDKENPEEKVASLEKGEKENPSNIEESKVEKSKIEESDGVVNATSYPSSYSETDNQRIQDGQLEELHLGYAGTQDYTTPEEVAEYIRQLDESQEYEQNVKVYMEQWEKDKKEYEKNKKEYEKIERENERVKASMDWEIPERDKSKTTKELEKVGNYVNPGSKAIDDTLGKALKKSKMDKDAARLVTDMAKEAVGLIPGVGDAAVLSDISIHASMLKDAKTVPEKVLQGTVIASKAVDIAISGVPGIGTAAVGAKNAVLSLTKFVFKKIFL